MKKILLNLIAFLCILCLNTASAKEVTVEGFGINRDSALRDARRLAVEQVVGTFVDSSTLTENYAVAIDNIYTKSQGFVGRVTVLEEGASGGAYRVRALIDVNEHPNPALLQQVQAVVALNDPRIAVIVLKDGSAGVHEERIESAIMERLIDKGFSHIIDPKIVAPLQDARMLDSLYNGRPITAKGSSFGADFAVMAKVKTTTEQVVIPNFKGGSIATDLNSGRTEMTTKIIRLDTGAILETFTLDSSGLEFGNSRAETESLKAMAESAAIKVDEKFRRVAARNNNSVQFTVNARDYNKVTALIEELRQLPGVTGVMLREHNGARSLINVDTAQRGETIVELLRRRTKLRIYVDSVSANSAGLIVS